MHNLKSYLQKDVVNEREYNTWWNRGGVRKEILIKGESPWIWVPLSSGWLRSWLSTLLHLRTPGVQLSKTDFGLNAVNFSFKAIFSVEDWNQVISIDEDFTSILGVDAQAAFLSNMFTSKIWWTDEQLRFFKILFDGQGADSSLFFTVYIKWYNDYLWAHLQHFLIVFCWGPLICSLKILIWINVFLSFFRSFSDNFQLQISLRTKKRWYKKAFVLLGKSRDRGAGSCQESWSTGMLRLIIYLEGFHLWQAAVIHCRLGLSALNVSTAASAAAAAACVPLLS